MSRRLAPAPANQPIGPWLAAALTIGAVGLFFVVWIVMSRLVFVIPPPPETIRALRDNLGDGVYRRDLLGTASNALAGAAIGGAAGFLIGVGLGRSRLLRNIVQPIVLSLYALPKVLLYPLVVPLLGIDTTAKVFMGALFAVFPMIVIVTAAVATIPPVFDKLGRSLHATRWQSLIKIVLPAVRTPVVTGLRVGLGLSVLGVILAEFFATRVGIGRAIRRSYEVGDYATLFATVIVVTAVVAACTVLLWRLERRLGDQTGHQIPSPKERDA